MTEQAWDYAGALEQLAKQLPEGLGVDVGTGGLTSVSRPDSTNIDKIGYQHERRLMVVTFRNGGVYAYEPISWPTFHAIATAPSAGKAFHQHIRRPGPEAEFTTTRLDVPVLKGRVVKSDLKSIDVVITEEDLPDAPEPPIGHVAIVNDAGEHIGWAPIFDPSLQELEEALLKGDPSLGKPQAWPAAIITDDDEEDTACAHANLPAGQAPMLRCPDCGRVVARP